MAQFVFRLSGSDLLRRSRAPDGHDDCDREEGILTVAPQHEQNQTDRERHLDHDRETNVEVPRARRGRGLQLCPRQNVLIRGNGMDLDEVGTRWGRRWDATNHQYLLARLD